MAWFFVHFKLVLLSTGGLFSASSLTVKESCRPEGERLEVCDVTCSEKKSCCNQKGGDGKMACEYSVE